IHSTNTLERLNKEVKRRSHVVGIFPNEESITRLLGAVLTEQNKEWLLQNCYLPQHSMAEIEQTAENDVIEARPAQRLTDILPDRKAGSEFTPP
ncbi:transposase, partial [Candidatus Erwinia dacicola]|uniref:transposase n=1 Tax=Candidatus Erwinia dacicola TaxID=252393 RepID=UPI001FE0FDC7